MQGLPIGVEINKTLILQQTQDCATKSHAQQENTLFIKGILEKSISQYEI